MSKFNRYERYKDSGVKWIEQIPEHWQSRKIKHIGKLSAGGVNKKIEEGEKIFKSVHYMDVYRNSGREIGNSEDYLVISATQSQAENCTLKKGDVLFTSSSETPEDIGHAVAISENLNQTLYGYHLIRLRLDSNIEMDYRYRKYMFNNYYIRNYFSSRTQGITRYGLKYDDYKEVVVFIPPINEQNIIASLLDKKTAEIDRLIADKEKLIELLQEKRQAIISEVVTKGLNSDVKTKDSGIEWIGEMPEHWEVKKIKYLTSYIGSGKTPRGGSEVYAQEGIIFIRSQNVYPQGLRLDDVVFISEEIDSEMRNTRVKGDDVLLNITGASIGRASLAPFNIPKANVNQHVCIIRPVKTEILPSLLHQIICSNFIQNQIQFYQNGTSREGLNFEQIANLIVVIPNRLEEQRMLVGYIEDKIAQIDDLIESTSCQIQKLKEYRQSLIFEAVTGKIDIREFADIGEVIES